MRQIVAMGGGGWMMDDPALDRFVLGLTDAPRPRICFIPTASGDQPNAERFHEAFPPAGFDASILWLFDREVADIGAFLGEQDIVYVGGGNTVSMLAVWRAHGVDRALRNAYDAGVVMTGVSAGANCWFEACTTDSFELGRADLLTDGLGFAPGSFTPHYDSEPARRPAVLELIASGELPPGFACDDYAAVHLADGALREALRSRPEARAFRVEPVEGVTHEGPLDARMVG